MAAFDALIEAQLSGATIRATALATFDFASGMRRLWMGFGPLSVAGNTYEGLGKLGRLSAVNAGPGQAVEEVTFALDGSAEMLATFAADAAEAAGREAAVYLQFADVRRTDDAGNWVEWSLLDDPIQIFTGRMGPLMVERLERKGDDDPALRVISVRAQNPMINRRRPPYGYYSHRDQQARAPGDNLFVNASRMASAVADWPKF